MMENPENKNKFVLLQPRYCNASAIKLNPSQFSGRKDLLQIAEFYITATYIYFLLSSIPSIFYNTFYFLS